MTFRGCLTFYATVSVAMIEIIDFSMSLENKPPQSLNRHQAEELFGQEKFSDEAAIMAYSALERLFEHAHRVDLSEIMSELKRTARALDGDF